MREEARAGGAVHGGQASCGSVTCASRFLIALVTCVTHDGIPGRAASVVLIGAGRHTDQFGEAIAEGTQRPVADRENRLR